MALTLVTRSWPVERLLSQIAYENYIISRERNLENKGVNVCCAVRQWTDDKHVND